jgi:hypothetical protein
MVREVALTQGYVALVDDEVYERVCELNWIVRKYSHTCYAAHKYRKPDGGWAFLSLHRFLLDPPDHLEVDHINGDGLDCRRSNLRLATRQQNASNCRRRRTDLPYKGINQHSVTKRFRAAIKVNQKRIYSGMFATAEEAARAYDDLARAQFGEFAALNFPKDGERAA